MDAPEGLAVIDSHGRFVQVNRIGARLCGQPEHELVGSRSPFTLHADALDEPAKLLDESPTEQVTTWSRAGAPREFAYCIERLPSDPAQVAVAFRDVTDERHRQRRVAAIARTSAKLASQGSLTTTLDTLAFEVLQTDALAAVQILTLDEAEHGLRIMGSAGFRHWPDFFDRLLQCRQRGAALRMFDALGSGRPVVVLNRWSVLRDDPAWEPLRDYLSELPWDSFASVPLIIRGRAAGVLNVFFAPGQFVGRHTLEFLTAMAEQAAIAVDHAALMQHERDVARREERQRLARDLHDSIVQQVFSISMQAKSLEVLGQRGGTIPAEVVRRIADEVGSLSQTALSDLRAMVHELRPSSLAELGGLEEAIRALVDSTRNRTGLHVDLAIRSDLTQLNDEFAEDTYRIIAEAIHNVVKHAEAQRIDLRLETCGNKLHATVTDDGRGLRAADEPYEPGTGFGLRTMRERAERWGGTVAVEPRRGHGTVVRLALPLRCALQLEAQDRPDPQSERTSTAERWERAS
jgi:PAS domain S-box-containing protein